MKLNRILLLSLTVLLFCITPVYATGPTFRGIELIPLILFLIFPLIKFGIAYLFLKEDISKTSILLKTIAKMNTLTVIISLVWIIAVLAVFWAIMGPHPSNNIESIFNIIGITLIPLICDYYILRWQFNRLKNRGIISMDISNKKIIIITVLMYLAAVIGIIVLYYPLYYLVYK